MRTLKQLDEVNNFVVFVYFNPCLFRINAGCYMGLGVVMWGVGLDACNPSSRPRLVLPRPSNIPLIKECT